MINKKEILKKNYVTPDEYVLETLEESIESIYDDLLDLIPNEIKNKFDKFVEVNSFITDKKIEIAYKNGQDHGIITAKEMLLEELKNYKF